MKELRADSGGDSFSCLAFTLIELLVSITLLAIIVVMLAGLLNAALRTWGGVQSDSERHRSGRALTDFISRELREAMLPVEGMSTTATKADLEFLVDPGPVASVDDYQNGDSVFWQAPLATERTYGDLAEVGYFVKWVTNGSASTPTLCRFFVNPSVMTGTPAAVQQNLNYQIYTNPVWLTPDLLASVAPADKAHGYVGLFAENVIGLWVRSFGIDNSEPAARHATFDSRVGYPLKTGSGSHIITQQRYLPAMVKVSIAQVDSKYAGRLLAAKNTIRPLVNQSADASAFYTAAKAAANSQGVMNTLYPGIRIYSTDVYLDNGK